jgi:TolB-like protein/Tfp pilus assembly protein PilF
VQRAAEIIASLARTVQHAHERGILHRDIKPGNVLLDGDGQPHLADFGLARLVENESTITRTLEVLGTPSFIAPEQAAGNGRRLTNATDVYGLGAVFYQLLTGHPPFAGGTTYETIRLVLETEPRDPHFWNPKVDRDLTTICLKCLEKDPTRRYPSALALAEDLEHWLGHEPILARHSGIFSRSRKWVRRNPTRVALLSLGTALLGAIALLVWNRAPALPPAGIAVLPFENLDGDKANTAFVDGIQDDILTKLAKVADLKVIGRTSVMQYRGSQNARQIGEALRVSYVLEGSVRLNNGRIHLNTRLIDTRTSQDVWAQEYDRSLTDVFATQAEIAEQIADELHVQLSPREKVALAQQPTRNLRAYDDFVCAAALIDVPWEIGSSSDLLRGMEFLHEAIESDPNFLLAYCRLAAAADWFYFSYEHTPPRLALADAVVQSALRLAPDSGETHLAVALHDYWGHLDYSRAHAELEAARRTLPNDSRIPYVAGLIDRRQGRWDEAEREMERAVELDPRNVMALKVLTSVCSLRRDYVKASAAFDRALALKPDNLDLRISRACLIDVDARGDTRPLTALLSRLLAANPAATDEFSVVRFSLAYYNRNVPAAEGALRAFDGQRIVEIGKNGSLGLSRSFCEGLVARLKGDGAAAKAAFVAARVEAEEVVHAEPDVGVALSVLGLIDAQLGRKEEALREGRRAEELSPLAQNALEGADALYALAMIYAWTGERDLAVTQLQQLARIPGGPSYGDLHLDPAWDSLQDNPRFRKIVASLTPNDAKTFSQRFP